MSRSTPQVLVVTNIPSYHQVDFFDEIASSQPIDLEVWYSRPITPGRDWSKLPTPDHKHTFLPVYFNQSSFYVNPTFPKLILQADPDLTIFCQYSGLAYQLGMSVQSLRGKPWVFWSEPPAGLHLDFETRVPHWLHPGLQKIAFAQPKHHATSLWGIGKMAQEKMQRWAGRPSENLPYFSNLEPFDRQDRPYVPDGRVRFLFAGRYSIGKGFDTLLEAFAKLAERTSEQSWSLTLCGKGAQEDLIANYPHLAHRVDNRGFLELDQMPLVMKEHDVFVIPSRYDGWGMVVPEAMAAGMPIIATGEMGSVKDVGPHHDWLRCIDAQDTDGLFRSIEWYVEHSQLIEQLGTKAAAAAERYHVSAGATTFTELVHEALQESL